MTKIYLVADRPWCIEEHDAEISDDGGARCKVGATSLYCYPGTYALTREQAQQNAIRILAKEIANKAKEIKRWADKLTCCRRDMHELIQAQLEFLTDSSSHEEK